MDIERFITAGLGDTSYLVANEGEAVLVDPQRDAWRFLAIADARGWRVTHVLETHVHNDYLSGALEVRAATGAGIVAPARGGYAFPHQGADEGTEVNVGSLRLTALATPGHTPEHLAWTIHDTSTTRSLNLKQGGAEMHDPIGVFTGGSLLIGTAGRTDLAGADRTAELTALQASTLRRIAALADGVRIFPTHGSGSFCSVASVAASPDSTVGAERRSNPVLLAATNGPITDVLLGGLGRYPAYYEHMAPLNRAGPKVLGRPPDVPSMVPAEFAAQVAGGAAVVDIRSRDQFAAGHVPGSLNIELDDSFAAYVGWLVPFDAPIVLVAAAPETEAVGEAVNQLLRIGYEHVIGFLAGGVDAWASEGRAVDAYPTTSIDAVYREVADGAKLDLLDVRQPIEWRTDGVIPGAGTIFVADLPARLGELPGGRELTVFCKGGSRASIAASILDAAGFPVRLVATGGAEGWTDRFQQLERDAVERRQAAP